MQLPFAKHETFLLHRDSPLGRDKPAVGAKRRWLVTKAKGSPNFTMAMVEVAPGGSTLRHSHHYEHAMYFIDGNGELLESNGTSPVSSWEVVYIEPNETHQRRNTGSRALCFLTV